VSLAQFKPALAMNAELQTKYAANRLRVVRQLRYSLHNENASTGAGLQWHSGATVELKSNFTQSVEDAMDQYRFDRTRAQGNLRRAACWISAWGAGAFCGEQQAAMMSTRLLGAATPSAFQSWHDGAGVIRQPERAPHGLSVGEVWARDSWLEISPLHVSKRDSKKQIPQAFFRAITTGCPRANCWRGAG